MSNPLAGRIRPSWCFAVLTVICLLTSPSAAVARPSAMKLFPYDSLVFVRLANGRDTFERYKDTALGRIIRDPKMQPFVDRLHKASGEIYAAETQDKLGLSWEEIQRLPQGEIAFGIVAREDSPPAYLLLVDLGDDPTAGRRLLQRAYDAIRDEGGEFTEEDITGTRVTVIRQGGDQEQTFGVFEKENTIVAATDPEVIRGVLSRWSADGDSDAGVQDRPSGGPEDGMAETYSNRALADNPDFVSIIQQCRRPQDEPPQLIWFVDPVGLVREYGRDNPGLRVALAMFPALGVDGIKGVGGSMAVATREFDDLSHLHLLLENPRVGVLQLIAFESGSTVPQPWVPADIEQYVTWHWNVQATYTRLVALVDKFYRPGGFEGQIAEHISEPLGIDFREEIIDQAAGRFSWLTGYERPARFNSQRHVLAIEVNDEKAAQEILKRIVVRFPDIFDEREFGKIHYYSMMPEWLRKIPEEQRPFSPAVAVFDGYCFLSYSGQLLEQLAQASDGTSARLVDSIEYKLIKSKLFRESSGNEPAMVMIARFEATLRNWYLMLTSDETRENLERLGQGTPPAESEGDADVTAEGGEAPQQGNRFFAALAECLAEEELPPFDELVKYTAPAGGVLYDTDTGFHMMSFTLRRSD